MVYIQNYTGVRVNTLDIPKPKQTRNLIKSSIVPSQILISTSECIEKLL